MPQARQLGVNYWLLWLSRVINRFGDGFYSIAVSWLVYQETGSAAVLGGLWAAYALVLAGGQAVIAPLVDWADRRRLMLGIDVVRGIVAVTPLVLLWLGSWRLWQLYVLFIAMGLPGLPYGAAGGALLQGTVARGLLLRANAWLQGAEEAMYLVGPAVGGLVIARYDAPVAMAVDGLTFGTAALLLSLLPSLRVSRDMRTHGVRQRYLTDLVSGARTLRQNTLLLTLTGFRTAILLSDAAFVVLVVPYVTDCLRGTASGVGLLEGALSLGTIMVSLGAERLVSGRRGGLTLWVAPALVSLTTCALAASPTLSVAIGLQVVTGLAWGLFSIQQETMFQEQVENVLLGRTLMLRNSLATLATASGAMAAGFIAARLGVRCAFVLLGMAGLGLSLVITLTGRHVLSGHRGREA